MLQLLRSAAKSAATKVLRFAVTRNWVFLARVSVFCSADVNHADPVTGNTPLHICKSQKMCEILINKGANIHAVNLNNVTALQKLADKNINLLWCAMLAKDLELMQFLLERGADVNYPDPEGLTKGHPPIWWAVLNREIEILKLLLEHGANINYTASEGCYKGVNLLILARDGYKITIVKLLLEKGIDIDITQKQETLCWAAVHNANEVAKILLEKGTDVNHIQTEGSYTNLSPLWFAIRQNNLDLARLFIDKNANINFINKQGRTMLMAETVKGRGTSIVEFLIKNGATVDLEQQAWKDTLANAHDSNCVALIKNANEVKSILPMLQTMKMKSSPLRVLPTDLIKEVKTMLTGQKVTTQPKTKLN